MEYIKIKEQDAKHYIYEFEGRYPVIDEISIWSCR